MMSKPNLNHYAMLVYWYQSIHLFTHSSSVPNTEHEKLPCVKGRETLFYINGITHIFMHIHCQ